MITITRYRDYTPEIGKCIAAAVNQVILEKKLAKFLWPYKGLLFNNRNMFLNVILPEYEKKSISCPDYNKNIYEYIWESRYVYFSRYTQNSHNILESLEVTSTVGNLAETQLKNWIIQKGYIHEDFIEHKKGGAEDKAGIDFELKVGEDIFKFQVKKGYLKTELVNVDMIESDTDLIRGDKDYDVIVFVNPDRFSDIPLSVHFYMKPTEGLKNLDPFKGERSARWSLSKKLRWVLPNRVFLLN